jgi:hypothetical protein
VLSELVETCRSHDFTDIIVLHEHRWAHAAGCGRLAAGAWALHVYQQRQRQAAVG